MNVATSRDRMLQQNLNTLFYDSAIVCPNDISKRGQVGGVFDRDGNLLPSSQLHECVRNPWIEYNKDEVADCADTVIFLGTFHSIWGHALTDSLKKLWFLFTDEGKTLIANGARLVYIFLEQPDVFTLKILDYVGIDTSSLIQVTHPTRFRRVYIPDNSIVYDDQTEERYYTKEYKEIVEMLTANLSNISVDLPIVDKVYFTRINKFQNGREWGERDVVNAFRKAGYQIISPEDYSIPEQFYILRHCSSFATTEGSISHSALFCRPGTDVVLIRKCNRVNYHQLVVNQVVGLNVTYVDANCSYVVNEKCPLDGPFYLCLDNHLRCCLDNHCFVFPHWLKPSFWWYSLKRIKEVRLMFANRITVRKIERLMWKYNL